MARPAEIFHDLALEKHFRKRVFHRFDFDPLSLQQTLARRVAGVERLKAAQRSSLAEFDALFATHQHRAFCGEFCFALASRSRVCRAFIPSFERQPDLSFIR